MQNKEKLLPILNKILESELAGVMKYTHYGFMLMGYQRRFMLDWFKEQALENLEHARWVGEVITGLGEKPSLGIGEGLNGYCLSLEEILKDSLKHEELAKQLYVELLEANQNKNLLIEEYAKEMIVSESKHLGEVKKMLGSCC